MSLHDQTSTRPRGPRVLIVEDQQDLRLMLRTVLQMEGYRVEEASNAREGLHALSGEQFDLVLTDYAMPGGTGTWMLQEAARQGRLALTSALVVTAHPELVRPGATFGVVGKPIDLDRLLEQVRRILRQPDRPRQSQNRLHGSSKIELVLYVSTASRASTQAKDTMERALAGFDRDDVAYSICDLQENLEIADHDRVVFTPTLVKRHPEPRMWMVGDLRDGDVVRDLLRLSGVGAATRGEAQESSI